MIAGPLTHLSFRRAGKDYGRKHTPMPPTNAQRYRAYRIALAMRAALQPNTRDWGFRA